MPVTLELDEELVERLESQAKRRDISLKEWALLILVNASERPNRPETWNELNARRLDLIRKKHSGGLRDDEASELDELQDAAAKVCEPADRRRLEHLKKLEAAAGIASPNPND